jgi:hemerythrin
MIALTKWQKILATMYDLCGGEMKPLQYEDIVVEAFKKYTEDFQLRGYPQYPDSSDAHKQLYEMKKKGLLRTANKTFELTERGLEVAKQMFHDTTAENKDRLTKQEEAEIKRILNSAAFRLFQDKQDDSILDTDFYDYLGVTVRTSRGDFQGRLSNVEHAVKAHAEKRNDKLSAVLKDLHKFLSEKFKEEIEYRR